VSGHIIDNRVKGLLIIPKCNSQVYWVIKTFIEGMSKIVIVLKDSELSIVEVILREIYTFLMRYFFGIKHCRYIDDTDSPLVIDKSLKTIKTTMNCLVATYNLSMSILYKLAVKDFYNHKNKNALYF